MTTSVVDDIYHFFKSTCKRWLGPTLSMSERLIILAVIIAGVCACMYQAEHTHKAAKQTVALAISASSQASVRQAATLAPTSSSTSNTTGSTTAAPAQSSAKSAQANADEQAYEATMSQMQWENTMCVAPLDKINASISSTLQTVQTTATSERNAITYAPGTAQFRSAYNSVAFAYDFNIDLEYYDTYLSGLDSLNSSAHCNLPVAWQKPAYWDLLDVNGNYVPYVKGSSLSDY